MNTEDVFAHDFDVDIDDSGDVKNESSESSLKLDFTRGVDIEALKAPSPYCCCHPNNPKSTGFKNMWEPTGKVLHDPNIFRGDPYKICGICHKIVWQNRYRRIQISGEFDLNGDPVSIEFDALHPGQEDLFHQMEQYTYICVLCGRRYGKTTFATRMIAELALRNPGCTILWVANTLESAKRVSRNPLSEMLAPFELSGGMPLFNLNKSDNVAYICAQRNPDIFSKVYWCSAEAPLNIQGIVPGPDVVFMDECQHMPMVTWFDPHEGTGYVKPASDDRDAKVFFLGYSIGSTWFTQLFEQARLKYEGIKTDEPDHKDWAIHRASSWANPLFPAKRRLTALSLPKPILYNAYLAVPTIGGAGLFENMEIRDEDNPKGIIVSQDFEIELSKSRYMGVDLGQSRDYFVILTLDARGVLCNIIRFHKQGTNVMKEAIIDEWLEQGMPEILLDASSGGGGEGMMEMLDDAGVPYNFVYISNTEKRNNFINRVIEACSDGVLSIPETVPYVQELLEEMSSLTQISENNKVKYVSHGQKRGKVVVGAHDDIVMSLGMALDELYQHETIKRIPDHLLMRVAGAQKSMLQVVSERPAIWHSGTKGLYNTNAHLVPYSTKAKKVHRYLK